MQKGLKEILEGKISKMAWREFIRKILPIIKIFGYYK